MTRVKRPLKTRDITSRQENHTIQPSLFSPRADITGLKRFVVIGDAGSGTRRQLEIARQMEKYYEHTPFASVLVLGDNVYEVGCPSLFEERIEQPYQPLFEKGVRFYPVLGNHDVNRGYGDQQLAYWGVPSCFYSFKLGNVEFFALDTMILMPKYYGAYLHNLDLARERAEKQMRWLDQSLQQSRAEMKVVYGHYPLYTSGSHQAGAKGMRKILEPLLVKHQVDIYFAGHEHLYEQSKPIAGVRHFTSGAAGKRSRTYLPFALHPREKVIPKHHFMVFEITLEGLQYQVISRQGRVLDAGMVPKKAATRENVAAAHVVTKQVQGSVS